MSNPDHEAPTSPGEDDTYTEGLYGAAPDGSDGAAAPEEDADRSSGISDAPLGDAPQH